MQLILYWECIDNTPVVKIRFANPNTWNLQKKICSEGYIKEIQNERWKPSFLFLYFFCYIGVMLQSN